MAGLILRYLAAIIIGISASFYLMMIATLAIISLSVTVAIGIGILSTF